MRKAIDLLAGIVAIVLAGVAARSCVESGDTTPAPATPIASAPNFRVSFVDSCSNAQRVLGAEDDDLVERYCSCLADRVAMSLTDDMADQIARTQTLPNSLDVEGMRSACLTELQNAVAN